jgi:hypothetical protein
MAEEHTLEYEIAVQQADMALTAVFDRMRKPVSMITSMEDCQTAAIAFHYWLTEERPDVLAALEANAEFEPMMMETYIDLHSAAYSVEELGAPEDGVRIRHKREIDA